MTLDTNIIIAYLAGEADLIDRLEEFRRNGIQLFLPAVADAEVLSFSYWTDGERKEVASILEQNFVVVPFDHHMAFLTGCIRSVYRLKFPDASIAATALYTKSPLITRNAKDFQKIQELRLHFL